MITIGWHTYHPGQRHTLRSVPPAAEQLVWPFTRFSSCDVLVAIARWNDLDLMRCSELRKFSDSLILNLVDGGSRRVVLRSAGILGTLDEP